MQKKSVILLFVFFSFSLYTFSQEVDSTKVPVHLGGSVTVTNNGISFIPTFSLRKPAAIFDLSVGRRLSFDKNLVWNVSLIYAFNKKYVEQ